VCVTTLLSPLTLTLLIATCSASRKATFTMARQNVRSQLATTVMEQVAWQPSAISTVDDEPGFPSGSPTRRRHMASEYGM
jgi:hypothetical protein